MAVDNLQVLDIIGVMEAFLERKRPPEHIRPKVDIGYKIEGQSIIIHEIRPFWNDSSKTICPEVAKTTFVKTRKSLEGFLVSGRLEMVSIRPQANSQNT